MGHAALRNFRRYTPRTNTRGRSWDNLSAAVLPARNPKCKNSRSRAAGQGGNSRATGEFDLDAPPGDIPSKLDSARTIPSGCSAQPAWLSEQILCKSPSSGASVGAGWKSRGHGQIATLDCLRIGCGLCFGADMECSGLGQSAATDWTRTSLRTGRERGLFADTDKLRS
jgi:hypothetical protein